MGFNPLLIIFGYNPFRELVSFSFQIINSRGYFIMIDCSCVERLGVAGFCYKPAESPSLWSHLEERFNGGGGIGPKFLKLPERFVHDLLASGESALLRQFVEAFEKTGRIGRTMHVVKAPYLVGTRAARPISEADAPRLLKMIAAPGTWKEELITVLPVTEAEIPYTNEITFEGGVYADGKTVGYFDVHPGNALRDGQRGESALLATPSEIKALAEEMRRMIEEVSVVPYSECEAMAAAALKAVKARS